jgi:hypothetical protein
MQLIHHQHRNQNPTADATVGGPSGLGQDRRAIRPVEDRSLTVTHGQPALQVRPDGSMKRRAEQPRGTASFADKSDDFRASDGISGSGMEGQVPDRCCD